jgi:hypothetical protein
MQFQRLERNRLFLAGVLELVKCQERLRSLMRARAASSFEAIMSFLIDQHFVPALIVH